MKSGVPSTRTDSRSENESRNLRHRVEILAGVKNVGMLSDEHESAAAFDQAADCGHFVRRITLRRRLDHQHVEIGERFVVDRRMEARLASSFSSISSVSSGNVDCAKA